MSNSLLHTSENKSPSKKNSAKCKVFNLRSYSAKDLALQVGSWQLICAPPGSGKSFLIQTILDNCDLWLGINPSCKNRLILAPGDGVIKTCGEKLKKVFKEIFISDNFIEDIPKFKDSFLNFDSNVVIVDDFIYFSSMTVANELRELFFKRLRHKRLLIIIAVHTLTHVQLFSGFLGFAKKVFFLASSANRNSLLRLCTIYGAPGEVKDLLTARLHSMSHDRQVKNIYDFFMIDREKETVIFNLQTKPLFEKKLKVEQLNEAVALFQMDSEFWLVPKDKLKLFKDCSDSPSEEDLSALLSEEVKSILKDLEEKGACFSLSKNSLTIKKKKQKLIPFLVKSLAERHSKIIKSQAVVLNPESTVLPIRDQWLWTKSVFLQDRESPSDCVNSHPSAVSNHNSLQNQRSPDTEPFAAASSPPDYLPRYNPFSSV